ncbi:MAG: hypothetical protein GXO39_00150 [Thermotogae bacterium]|nr:hypothetical protein [Thermotogota bacterium]
MSLRRFLFLSYILSLIVFKAYVTVVAFTGDYPLFTSDAQDYMRIAHNLRTYSVFSSDPHPPLKHDVIRMPIYPVVLSILGSKGTLLLQNLLLILAVMTLVMREEREKAMLLFLSPTVSVFTNQNLTEGLYVPLLVFVLLYKGRFQGILWGILALLRQATLLLFPPLLLLEGLRRRSWRFILLNALLFILPVGLWMTTNAVLGGAPIFSGVFTTTLTVYLMSKFTDVSSLLNAYNEIPTMGEWISNMTKVVFPWILSHPMETIGVWLKGVVFTLFKAIPRGYLKIFGPLWPLAYLLFYPYLLYIYRRILGDRGLTAVGLFYILGVALPGSPRLRLPVEILAILKRSTGIKSW